MSKPAAASRLAVITACIHCVHQYAEKCLLEGGRDIDTDRFTEIPSWCRLPVCVLAPRAAAEPSAAVKQSHPHAG